MIKKSPSLVRVFSYCKDGIKRTDKGSGVMDEKKTYYIGIATGEITKSAVSSPWDFKIEANEQEIHHLRECFDKMDSTEWKNFFRAHIPFVEYHHDKENDHYDELLKQVYSIIYKLGDYEAKQAIDSMGIIHGRESYD